jgi:hypothetical protein
LKVKYFIMYDVTDVKSVLSSKNMTIYMGELINSTLLCLLCETYILHTVSSFNFLPQNIFEGKLLPYRNIFPLLPKSSVYIFICKLIYLMLEYRIFNEEVLIQLSPLTYCIQKSQTKHWQSLRKSNMKIVFSTLKHICGFKV